MAYYILYVNLKCHVYYILYFRGYTKLEHVGCWWRELVHWVVFQRNWPSEAPTVTAQLSCSKLQPCSTLNLFRLSDNSIAKLVPMSSLESTRNRCTLISSVTLKDMVNITEMTTLFKFELKRKIIFFSYIIFVSFMSCIQSNPIYKSHATHVHKDKVNFSRCI